MARTCAYFEGRFNEFNS